MIIEKGQAEPITAEGIAIPEPVEDKEKGGKAMKAKGTIEVLCPKCNRYNFMQMQYEQGLSNLSFPTKCECGHNLLPLIIKMLLTQILTPQDIEAISKGNE